MKPEEPEVVSPPAPPEGQLDVKLEDQSQEEALLINRKTGLNLKGINGNRANDYIEVPKTANQSLVEEISPVNVKPIGLSDDPFDSVRPLKEEDPII